MVVKGRKEPPQRDLRRLFILSASVLLLLLAVLLLGLLALT